MTDITENAKKHQKCRKTPQRPKITKYAKITEMPKIRENSKNHRKY